MSIWTGSPPPMRGKVYAYFVYVYKYRITPAYAGKSFGSKSLIGKSTDHPRLCGEKFPQLKSSASAWGSPPPMRGKGLPVLRSPYVDWDHPRLCGEKPPRCPKLNNESGSPPPMRGKGPVLYASILRCGITPAYAGKSALRIPLLSCRKDHPRLCGEKSSMTAIALIPAGSPPPMRGKACSGWSNPLHFRITPAYAGKSRSAEYAMLL